MAKYYLNRPFIALYFVLLLLACSGTANAQQQRVYANQESHTATLLSSVTNPANADDQNPQTFSTLNVLVAGTASQKLSFTGTNKPTATTPVSIKIGTASSLLTLLSGATVQAYNGTTPVGTAQTLNNLVTLLDGGNQYEVTFTPGVTYDGVQVSFSGVSLGGSLNVYEAYFNKATTNVNCDAPVDELHGVNSLGLASFAGSVTNPLNAIDGSLSTFAVMNSSVGVAAYTQETALLPGVSVLGDSVRIYISTPAALLGAQVISSLTVDTYLGNTDNNDANANAGLLNIQLLSAATNMSVISFAPTHTFNRIQVRLGGIASVLTSVNVYEIQRVQKNPTLADNGHTNICSGNSAILSATSPANTQIQWYDASTSGTLLHTGSPFTTPALTSTKVYYVDAIRTGCTNTSDLVPDSVIVVIPIAPTVPASSVICKGQATTITLTNPVAGTTYNWYNAATGGTLVYTGTSFTTPPLNDTTRYYVEAAQGSCTSATRSLTTVIVNALPTTPAQTPAIHDICYGTTTTFMVTNPQTGVIYNWYDSATGGHLLFTGTTYTTPALTRDTSYYIEAQNTSTGCVSTSRTKASVKVHQLPNIQVNPVSQTISSGQTATMTASSTTSGATFNWYMQSTGGNSLSTNATYTTNPLTMSQVFYVEADSSTCASARIPSTVLINTNPGGGSVPCNAATTQTNTVNGVCIGCGVTNPQLAVDTDSASASTLSVLAGLLGAYVEQTFIFPSVINVGDSVRIRAHFPSALLNLGLLSNIQVSSANGTTSNNDLTAVTTNPVTLNLLPGNQDADITFAPAQNFDRVSVRLNSGAASLLSSLMVNYATHFPPSPVFVTDTVNICSGQSASLSATAPAGSMVQWYSAPTGGSLLHSGSNYNTPVLTDTTKYYAVSVTTAGCPSPDRAQAVVNVQALPTAPAIATTGTHICSGQPTTLTVSNPQTGVVYNWYTAATGGTSVHTGASYTTDTLKHDTTFYVTAATTAGCTNTGGRASVAVEVGSTPANVQVVPATQTISSGQTATINATSSTPGATFSWYTLPAGGSSLATGPAFTTPALTANQVYYVEADSATCAAARVPATVIINTNGNNNVPCNAAITQINDVSGICIGCSITNPQLAVDTDSTTASTIQVIAGLLGAYAEQSLIFPSVVNAGDSARIRVHFPTALLNLGVLSSIQVASYNGTIYNNDRATANGGGLITLALLPGNQDLNITFAPTQSYDRIQLRLNSGVASVISTVQVSYAYHFYASPVVSPDTVNICSGQSATLTATAPSGASIQWYNAPTGGSLLYTGTSFTTPALTDTIKYYAVSASSAGCASPNSTQAVVNVQSLPAAAIVTGGTGPCNGQPTTLTINNAQTGVVYNWYTVATGGTPVHTGTSFTTGAITSDTTFYVEAVKTGGCTNTSGRTNVQVTPTTRPVAPVVAAAGTSSCSGQPTTLTISNPQSGITYNWYDSATNGHLVHAGTSFTTDTLTTSKAYYVEAVNSGGCNNAGGRTTAAITVGTTPANVQVTPATQTISSGQTASLLASSATPGVTYNWYTQPSGGNIVFTGASYTTNPLTVSTTFYAEVVLGSCAAARAPGIVNISTGTGGNVPCEAATTQTNTVSGICIGCGVTNPALAVDTDSTTASTISVLAGLTGGYAQQTLIFPSVAKAGDTTSVKVTFPAIVTNTGVLSSIQLASYNGATYNNDRTTVSGGGLVQIGLLGGNQTGYLKFAPTQAYDRIEIRVNSGLASLLTSVNVNYANHYTTSPVLAVNPIKICSGGSALFTIPDSIGRNFYWYDASTNGMLVRSGATFNTPNLTANTSYYVASVSAAGCPAPNRTQAVVNVDSLPNAPVIAATGTTTCSGQTTTLTISNAQAGITYNWYDAAVNGNLVHTGNNFTTGVLTHDTTFYVQASNSATCGNTGGRTSAVVKVNTTPNAAIIAATGTNTCSGQATTLTISNTQAGVTYNWYSAAANGNLLHTGSTFTTGTLTKDTAFYVEAVGTGGCINTGGRTTATVTVGTTPVAPVVAAVGTCVGQSATLAVTNPQAGITYNWYNVATGGTILTSGNSFTTGTINKDTTFYVEAVSAGGCGNTGGRTIVMVTAGVVPNAPVIAVSGTNICAGQATTLTVSNAQPGVTYNWYSALVNGSLLNTGTSFTTGVLTRDTTFYVAAVSTTGCTNTAGRVGVTVTMAAVPVAPVIASAVGTTICSGQSVTLTINNVQAGATYNWYSSATGGVVVATGTSFTTGMLSNDTTFYEAAISAGGCANTNRASAAIHVNQTPPMPSIVAGGQSICGGQPATLNIHSPVTGATYNWYNAASGGTLVYTGVSFTTGLLTKDTIFYLEGVGPGGCSSARTTVPVFINSKPAAPVIAAGGQTACSGNTTTISVNNPVTGTTYNWYDAATAGNLLFSGTSFTTPILTSSKTYYVEAANGSCTSAQRTQVTVTVTTTPAVPVVSANGTVTCTGQPTTLSVDSARMAITYQWYSAASGGTLLGTGSTFMTPPVTSPVTYYVQASNGACPATMRTGVTVTSVSNPAPPSIASTGTTICAGNTTMLMVSNPQAGYIYNWFDKATGGNLVNVGDSFTTGTLTNDTTFYVASSLASGCASSARTSVKITVNAAPSTPVVANATVPVCNGNSATLQVANPVPGYTYNWYTAATSGTAVATGPTYVVNNITTNKTYYVQATNATGCPGNQRAPVNVIVSPAPAPATVAVNVPAVCPGSTVTITAQSTDPNATFRWFNEPNSTTAIYAGNPFTSGPINTDTTFYVEVSNANGCVSNSRTAATVPVYTLIAPEVTVASITPTSITFQWPAVPGATGYRVSLDSGNTFIIPSSGPQGLTHTVSGLLPGVTISIIMEVLSNISCINNMQTTATTATTRNPLTDVFVPNVFSPNGDGKNDFFKVYGNEINQVEMYIYNQWGQKIYQEIGAAPKWDGTAGGQQQPVGVYIFVVKVTMRSGEIITKKNAVNLIR